MRVGSSLGAERGSGAYQEAFSSDSAGGLGLVRRNVCQGGKQSPPRANAGPLVRAVNKRRHYRRDSLPARAGTQIRASISALGENTKDLSAEL